MRAGAAGARSAQITGTDTGAGGDDAEMVAAAPTHAVVADRRSAPARLAGPVASSGSAWPPARCATRCPTTPGWCWRRSSARCCTRRARRRSRRPTGDAFLASTHTPDAGRDAGAVRGGRRVDGARRRLDHDGHRQAHRARARADRAAAGHADDGPQPAVPSRPSPSRRWWPASRRSSTGGATRARSAWPPWPSWCCSTRRTRGRWSTSSSGCGPTCKALPGVVGSSRPERLVDDIASRLRRIDPADLEDVAADGARAELADLLDGMHRDLRELSERHHRDPPVAARRHAAAVGTRRTAGRAVTAFPDGPTASGRAGRYADHPPHGVPVLRRGHQLLRPRLPDARATRARQRCLSHELVDRPGGRRQLHQPRRLRQHQLVLPRHRARTATLTHHQQLGRRGGSAAAGPLRGRLGAAPWEIARPVGAGRRAGHRVHAGPAAAGDHRRGTRLCRTEFRPRAGR